MWLSTRFLVSVAALSWAVLAFCPAKAPDHDPLPGAVPGFSASAPLVQQDERPVGKNQSRPPAPRTRRQLSLSAYNNPEHGVDRKSTRLNSSHLVISYAVFCL